MATALLQPAQQQQQQQLAGPSMPGAPQQAPQQPMKQLATTLQKVEHTLAHLPQTLPATLKPPKPQSLIPAPILQSLHSTAETIIAPLRVAAHAVQPWKWKTRRPPPSVARVTLRNNFVALSAVGVVWYLGVWDLVWEGVRRGAGQAVEMVMKRLLLFTLIANIIESAYTLSYPPPLPPAIADPIPTYKPATLSPAHRKLIERSLQDLPPPAPSPFSSPAKPSQSQSQSFSRSASLNLSRSASLNLSASRSSVSSSNLNPLAASGSSLASTLRKDEASKDPLSPENPESPLRAFEGRRSPRTGRALGAGDLERMRRERW